MQGKIIGQMNSLGFSAKEEATLTALTSDVVKSSEIEGELLNYDQVRSSIARRLGINTAGLVPSSRHIDGVVEMMLDATQRYALPLTEKRLFGWHAALFPTRHSGPYLIEVGRYRTGEMQVVSGAMGKEKVHYEAVKPERVKTEMDKFLNWFNNENRLDPVLKAAIAHFIYHPVRVTGLAAMLPLRGPAGRRRLTCGPIRRCGFRRGRGTSASGCGRWPLPWRPRNGGWRWPPPVGNG